MSGGKIGEIGEIYESLKNVVIQLTELSFYRFRNMLLFLQKN